MNEPFSVYLVRHAIAAERGAEWPNDDERPLTSRGAARFREVVAGLAALGVSFDEILTSPAVRTIQTAELLAQGLTAAPPIVELAALSPTGSIAAVLGELAKRVDRDAVALVGHEPAIGTLAARLAGAATPFEFKKGAVCRIDFDRPVAVGDGRLVWFAPPRLLRQLGD